jgi:hypothetical protein
VNTSVHFTKEAPGSTCRPASSGHEQSRLASSVSIEGTGFLVLLANHQRKSRPPYSSSTRCESVRGISPTQQGVSTTSLFQQSRFSFVHSTLSCPRYSFIGIQSMRFAAGQLVRSQPIVTKAIEKYTQTSGG